MKTRGALPTAFGQTRSKYGGTRDTFSYTHREVNDGRTRTKRIYRPSASGCDRVDGSSTTRAHAEKTRGDNPNRYREMRPVKLKRTNEKPSRTTKTIVGVPTGVYRRTVRSVRTCAQCMSMVHYCPPNVSSYDLRSATFRAQT